VDRKTLVMATLTIICLLFAEKERSCTLITAKGNVTSIITEWPACAPTAHAVVRSCRKFEKHSLNKIKKLMPLCGTEKKMSIYYTEH
jgi:hypothetical protein